MSEGISLFLIMSGMQSLGKLEWYQSNDILYIVTD